MKKLEYKRNIKELVGEYLKNVSYKSTKTV